MGSPPLPLASPHSFLTSSLTSSLAASAAAAGHHTAGPVLNAADALASASLSLLLRTSQVQAAIVWLLAGPSTRYTFPRLPMPVHTRSYCLCCSTPCGVAARGVPIHHILPTHACPHLFTQCFGIAARGVPIHHTLPPDACPHLFSPQRFGIAACGVPGCSGGRPCDAADPVLDCVLPHVPRYPGGCTEATQGPRR